MSSVTSAQHTSILSQNTGDTQYNVPNAALRGASLAFSKPILKPKPQINYTGGSNGAYLAANIAGAERSRSATSSRRTSPVRRNWTGGTRPNGSVGPYSHGPGPDPVSTLDVPTKPRGSRTPSPSNIAAKLAAARYNSTKIAAQQCESPDMDENRIADRTVPVPTGIVGNALARFDSRSAGQSASKSEHREQLRHFQDGSQGNPQIKESVDRRPIPPTTSLVQLFNGNPQSTTTRLSIAPASAVMRPPLHTRAQRSLELRSQAGSMLADPSIDSATGHVQPQQSSGGTREMTHSSEANVKHPSSRRDDFDFDSMSTAAKALLSTAAKSASGRSTPPIKRTSMIVSHKSDQLTHITPLARRLSSSMSTDNLPSPSSSFVSAKEEQEELLPAPSNNEKSKPSLPPPRRSSRRRSDLDETAPKNTWAASSSVPGRKKDPFVPVATPGVGALLLPPRASDSRATSPGGSLLHSNYQRESVKSITKHLTGESISSAIVGAAIAASSRNASPVRLSTATPPLPARKPQHHHLTSLRRSPSPPKAHVPGKMRSTMRKDPSSSDEDDGEKYRKKGTRIMGLGRKHPNKHHEGTRKRWRDQITERERKRYEGVWAANKGLLLTHTQAPSEDVDLDVHALTAREIWLRSRLPNPVLEEVWDLVDSRAIGRLRREEFVVAMWLIDQRLKGRKLPARVSESVWTSVKGAGVKVKVKTRR